MTRPMLLLAQIKFADLRSRNTVSGSGSVVKTCQVDSQTTPSCVDAVRMLWGTWRYLVDGFPRSFDNLRGWEEVIGNTAGALVRCVSIDPLDW